MLNSTVGTVVVLAAFSLTMPAWCTADADTINRCPGDEKLGHLVVIFDENVSFDHYFATYPVADPPFKAKPDTPSVNGLNTDALWAHNPNSTRPFLLTRKQYATSDQDHGYSAEQEAFDNGLMDLFPESTGSMGYGPDYGHGRGIVMGVYDGNTVTAVWNYAQNFAMNDNSFGTTFGPSTPGALNLVAGRTGPVVASNKAPSDGYLAGDSLIDDADPFLDQCQSGDGYAARIGGKNIGDLLKDQTWGWFQGGFRLDPKTKQCSSAHFNKMGKCQQDYVAHHEPFQYFDSTANLDHRPPSDRNLLGTNGDGTNHQYDMSDFIWALQNKHLPTISFLKASKYQDGHAGYSDPLDEQTFLVKTINKIEASSYWNTAAIIIMWDDSDGWYDHVMSPIVSQSDTPYDSLTGTQSPSGSSLHPASHMCGTAKPDALSQGRCGYGPRLPFLVVSPFAKINFVDHSLTDQSSVIRYIEDRWLGGTRLGKGSTDEMAGSLCNMFDFNRTRHADPIFLDPDYGTLKPGNEPQPPEQDLSCVLPGA